MFKTVLVPEFTGKGSVPALVGSNIADTPPSALRDLRLLPSHVSLLIRDWPSGCSPYGVVETNTRCSMRLV